MVLKNYLTPLSLCEGAAAEVQVVAFEKQQPLFDR
jgi:hypothetical protein